MAGRGTTQRTGGQPYGETRDQIPKEIDETIERRLAELRPLHDEYTQLLSYRRLVAPTGCTTDPQEQAKRRGRATPGVARAAILAALGEGPKTSAELALELAVTPATLQYNLRRLTRTGVIDESRDDDIASYSLADGASRKRSP